MLAGTGIATRVIMALVSLRTSGGNWLTQNYLLFASILLVPCLPSTIGSPVRAQTNSARLLNHDESSVAWRRTQMGWERMSEWELKPRPEAPRIAAVHPLVIACLQLLSSVGALLVWTARLPTPVHGSSQ
jgi:hypothetical protein